MTEPVRIVVVDDHPVYRGGMQTLPGINGIEATRAITAAQPTIGVLVLTMYDDDDSVFSALRAGARGYLLKGSDQAEIERGVRAVAAGQAIFAPAMAARIAEWFAGRRDAAQPVTAFESLTPREDEVLQLIAAGLSNRAIAERLFLSEKTVRNHVSNVFLKLQAADRAEAIVRAREAGYGRR